MASNSRGYSAGKLALELEGDFAGFLLSVEGGEAFAEVVNEPPGDDKVVRKHPGPVAFSPIVLSFGTGMSKALYKWMSDLLTRNAEAKSGAIVFLGLNYKEKSRLTFAGAIITEISFPAVAADSKDAAHVTLTIQPERTQRTTSSGVTATLVQSKTPKWVARNFRLDIVGLEASNAVTAIDALVIKRPVTRGTREAAVEAGTLEIPNVAFRIPERSSAGFIDWFDKLVVGGGSEKNERNGTLDFLDPSLKTALFSLSFVNLGIVAVRRERSVGNSDVMAFVKVECYCEEMAFVAAEKTVEGAGDAGGSSSSSSAPGSAPTAPAMISLTDTLLGIISGRIQGEAAARAALEIARSQETLGTSTATKSELVARRLLATVEVPEAVPTAPQRAEGAAIGEKWATGRATLEELKNVAVLESRDWSALRLDVDHSLIAELADAGVLPTTENGPIELERSEFVEGIVAGASGVLRGADQHLVEAQRSGKD